MSNHRVSIIILNFNGFTDTLHCLKTLLKTNYPHFKIVVVDNGSEKNEAILLSKKIKNKKVEFVRFEKNYGFTGGNNKILKTIKDKYVVLLNNDTETTPNWLKPLVSVMEKNPKIAAVQPKILWMQDKRYFDYAGACGGFIDMFGYPFTRGRIFNTIEKDTGQYDTVKDIFWASGAAMLIRTSIFKKVGYFDELFFNYMEEIDLCYRIHNAGYRVVCEPKSFIYHKVASTASKNYLQKRYWEHRNNLLLILKNFSTQQLFFIFPLRILSEYLSILYYLFNKRIDFALAVLKSQVSLLYLAPLILLKRKKSKSRQQIPGYYNKSIIFSYFILRKKNYSEIF